MPRNARFHHTRRAGYLINICRYGSMFGVFLGLVWLAIFVAAHHWPAAAALVTLGMLAIPCWLVARSGKFSLGLMLAQILCAAYIVAFALIFDIPSAAIPRTTHLYLLVIAMVGFINYRREPSLLQLPIILATLAAFIAIAAVNPAIGLAIPMSEACLLYTSPSPRDRG